MKTRVTITLDPKIHEQAKALARARRTTVSGLVENFLRGSAAATGASVVDGMVGSGELREPAPGQDPLHDALRARFVDRH